MARSLLDIASLSLNEFNDILDRADKISKGHMPQQLKSKPTVATLFYENSTRTLVSFELAAKRLGYLFTNIDITSSSEIKGEVFIDTLKTLAAMSIDGFVIRHKEEHLLEIAKKALPDAHFINAGDGMHAHPSQALLDSLTIKQHFKDISTVRIAIVGDIKHSRVTNSLLEALDKLGVKDIRLCAPDYLLPLKPYPNVSIETSLDKALSGANVVYALRVQKERFVNESSWSLDAYINDYCLTSARLDKASYAPILMHPGPMNRGIEICSEVADGQNSVILKQVQNGLFTRMAILNWVFS